ncbi:MAG: spondin domain-containing protein [Verrucomicrobiales bacterium]
MKSHHPKNWHPWAAVCPLAFFIATADAATLRVTITNLAAPGGLHFTPVFAGFHDGGFDSFNPAAPASAALEALAEDGNNAPMLGDFLATSGRLGSNIIGVTGLGPGIFTPGHSSSFDFGGVDATSHRYFSYASMLLPSNDAFFGNANPLGREIFDASGTFLGADFTILGSMLWDAGTEENDTLGAPFSMIGGSSTPTIGGTVLSHPGLDNFVGSVLGNGVTLTSAFGSDTPVVRIQVSQVPEPGGLWLSLMATLGLVITRRTTSWRRASTDR